MSTKRPTVSEAAVYAPDLPDGKIRLDTVAWFIWLETPTTTSFSYPLFDPACGYIRGYMTVRKESRQRGGSYWSVYRRSGGRLRKIYLGRSASVTCAHLEEIARTLLAALQHEE
jgi:hypothetical protein